MSHYVDLFGHILGVYGVYIFFILSVSARDTKYVFVEIYHIIFFEAILRAFIPPGFFVSVMSSPSALLSLLSSILVRYLSS